MGISALSLRVISKMDEFTHTILCVDDEQGILKSLKRLFRKDSYRFLTASSGRQGLLVLEENNVDLVLSDQRMTEMSGSEFLAKVKEKYPDTMRIILTGYTDVDSITESINKGNIYKFLLKPWKDDELKQEIKRSLEQHDLFVANRKLNEENCKQKEKLEKINRHLEEMVQERTVDLEIQNQALQLSQVVLNELPCPVIGVGLEGMIAIANRETKQLYARYLRTGDQISDYFSGEVVKNIFNVIENNEQKFLKDLKVEDKIWKLAISPLTGEFRGKGAILLFYV